MNIFIRFLPAILSALMPVLIRWVTIELEKPERRREWLALASLLVSLHREVSNDVSENDASIKRLNEERKGSGPTPDTT